MHVIVMVVVMNVRDECWCVGQLWGDHASTTRHKRFRTHRRATTVSLGTCNAISPFSDVLFLFDREPSKDGLAYKEFVVYRGEQAYPEYLITYYIVP